MTVTDIKRVAKAIKQPVSTWPGRCHEIANLCLKARLVPAGSKLRYGMWLGPISPDSQRFAGRSVTHHGWIELPDGIIYDPTRWVFEAVKPYVYVGLNVGQWYDMGGNALRERLMDCSQPPPEMGEYITIPPSQQPLFARYLPGGKSTVTTTFNRLMWLASLPLHRLGQDAKPIYETVIAMGLRALIPLDNREAVLS